MAAKDYKLCVSGLGGKPFISKVSKSNPNLMLSDRREIPLEEMYVAIEEFAKGQIAKGYSTLQVTAGGKMVFEIRLPNPKAEEKEKKIRNIAERTLEQINEFELEFALEHLKELANYILELTN